jgi:hypothetical protein
LALCLQSSHHQQPKATQTLKLLHKVAFKQQLTCVEQKQNKQEEIIIVQAMPSINSEKTGTKENYITEDLINKEHKWICFS